MRSFGQKLRRRIPIVRAAPMGSPALLLSVLATVCAALPQDCPPKFRLVRAGDDPCCSGCPAGNYLEKECTAHSDSTCATCPKGSYSEQWNNIYSCFRCDECGYAGMKYKRNCTSISNAQCECSDGYVCKDSNCRSCILPGVESIPCSTGTFSTTGTRPCQLWTNCTSLGQVEIVPANQTSDATCDYIHHTQIRQKSLTLEVIMSIIVFISLILLCLSVGVHIAKCRRKRKVEFVLLPVTDKTQAALPTLSEDTITIRHPEQECGGPPQPQKLCKEHTSVEDPCGC